MALTSITKFSFLAIVYLPGFDSEAVGRVSEEGLVHDHGFHYSGGVVLAEAADAVSSQIMV